MVFELTGNNGWTFDVVSRGRTPLLGFVAGVAERSGAIDDIAACGAVEKRGVALKMGGCVVSSGVMLLIEAWIDTVRSGDIVTVVGEASRSTDLGSTDLVGCAEDVPAVAASIASLAALFFILLLCLLPSVKIKGRCSKYGSSG
jgi:hypothetical protein